MNIDIRNNDIDILDRNTIIDKISQMITTLSANKAGCTFAIEGKWGVGKTYLISNLELKLSEEIDEYGLNKYFIFHYNCWKYDYYNEPIVAIASFLIDAINEQNPIDDKLKKILLSVKKGLIEVCRKLSKIRQDMILLKLFKMALKMIKSNLITIHHLMKYLIN